MFNKKITIYYHQFDNDCTRKESDFMYESCLSLDGVGFEPESLLSLSDGEEIYNRCPIWRHRQARTFAIRSPLDTKIEINTVRKSIRIPTWTNAQFQHYIAGNPDPNWCTDKRISMQMSIPKFLFWTNAKNVWIEQKLHWETAVKNNFIAVGGWFNMSEWERTINIAFDVVDHKKPVNIKRGDIIYEVAFHAPNKTAEFKLVKQTPPKSIVNKFIQKSNIKRFLPYKTLERALGHKESKCPVDFLWNRSPQDKG